MTCSSLMATQELEGKPWSMGTRNWRQPDQWPIRSIMQIRLKIRMNTPSELMNCVRDMTRRERKKYRRLDGKSVV